MLLLMVMVMVLVWVMVVMVVSVRGRRRAGRRFRYVRLKVRLADDRIGRTGSRRLWRCGW